MIRILLLLGWLGLTGCANQSTFSSTLDVLNVSVFGQSESAYSDDYVKNLPYASISAKLGKGERSLLVLGKAVNGRYYWYSADRVALVTEHGRVVKTLGLETDLLISRARSGDPLAQLQRGVALVDQQPETYTRLLDYSRHDIFGAPQVLSLNQAGEEQLTLLGQEYRATVYEESFEVADLKWSGVNRYWVSQADGRLLQSQQSLMPGVPAVLIEYLNLPAQPR